MLISFKYRIVHIDAIWRRGTLNKTRFLTGTISLIIVSCIIVSQCVANPILTAEQVQLISEELELPSAKAFPYLIHFESTSIARTNDGYVISCTSDEYPSGGLVFKVNERGSVQWINEFGLEYKAYVERIIRCQDGGFVTIGRSFGEGASGIGFLWMARLAADGTLLWQKEHSECFWGTDIKECQDGGFIIAGSYPDVVRTNSEGDILWNYTSNWYRCHTHSVVECDNGDIALTGGMSHSSSGYDGFLIRLTGSGSVLWSKTYDYAALTIGQDLIQTEDGGFAIGGESGSWNYYPRSFWLLRTDETGTVLFEKEYFDGQASSITECSSGGFALTGTYHPSDYTPDWDAAFVRTDSNGIMMYQSFCIGPDEDRAFSLVTNIEGDFAVSGLTTGSFSETNENGTFTYNGNLPFLWRLNDEHRENVTLPEIDNSFTAPPSETTTTPTSTEGGVTTEPQIDTTLVMMIGVTGGILVIFVTIVGLKGIRPS
jgi:hypothetical protein